MKRSTIVTIVLLLYMFFDSKIMYAQKMVIDTSAYTKWQFVDNGSISNNGKYISYTIKSGTYQPSIVKQVIRSIDSQWQLEIPGGSNEIKLSLDGNNCIYRNSKDSLCIVILGTSISTYIPNVSSWKLPEEGNGDWLFYKLKNNDQTLHFRKLKNGKEKLFSGVISYQWSDDGRVLITRVMSRSSSTGESLNWTDMVSGRTTCVWKDAEPGKMIVDFTHEQFVINSNQNIWLYKKGMYEPKLFFNQNSPSLGGNLKLIAANCFNADGTQLFVTLDQIKPVSTVEAPKGSGVEVWSYLDVRLQSLQKSHLNHRDESSFGAMLDLKSKELITTKQYIDKYAVSPLDEVKLNLRLISYTVDNGYELESFWNKGASRVFNLVDTKTGNRRELNFIPKNNLWTSLSPNGKFIIYFDKDQNNYFSYDVKSGVVRNLTDKLKVSWLDVTMQGYQMSRGVATWTEEDSEVLIYDSYDIWLLDLSGKKAAINLTNGYGVKNHIVFNLGLEKYRPTIAKNEYLLLNAFNLDNKNNGFYNKKITEVGDPELLTMGPNVYHILLNNTHLADAGGYPIKSRDREIYLLRKSSATESSNYYTTKDFKSFTKISNIHPEKSYNWYTTELHTWKSFDGSQLQGILYKPENFDAHKKYPVIFTYYDLSTGNLNACLKPESSWGPIDITTYVSNGYLVFVPDIYVKIGDPMQGTYNSVVSAAEYLAKLPFVESAKLGLQGHSFGGIETNYLVTHTNLFAAACSSSGMADWISGYGGLSFDELGEGMGSLYETGQNRMGGSLWEKQDKYIKNSAVLNVDKVTTPFLIMHTKKDPICLYSNIMEFFTGLRRMGKKAWMLVYSDGIHVLHGKESTDYNFRMMQFFNHYLKDRPAPVWMTKGVPAASRGIDDGYELDTEIKTPGPGLLMPKEQAKVDSLMSKKSFFMELKK